MLPAFLLRRVPHDEKQIHNLLLQTLGCFISAAGIYSFAVAAEVPVTGIAASAPSYTACSASPWA